MRHVLAAAALAALACASAGAQDFEELLRAHYVGKIVEVKVPMPKAESPMLVYPQREEVFDTELLALKLERSGVGIEAGDLAAIREVRLHDEEIELWLIGLGQHAPALPPGGQLMDEEVWGRGESHVRLILDEPWRRSASTIAAVNELLSRIVSTRALVSDEGLPPEVREAVRQGVIAAGMNRRAVYLALGEPTEVLRDFRGGILQEAWLYEREDFTTLMVYFRDGVVAAVKEF